MGLSNKLFRNIQLRSVSTVATMKDDVDELNVIIRRY